jgi:hypothetical protein
MGYYESLYWSWWNHPIACWLGALVVGAALIWRIRHFYTAYLVLFLAFIAADATVTGFWSKLGGESSMLYTPLTFIFIVAGDLRVYLISEREAQATSERPWGGRDALLSAFVLAVIPSLLVQLGQWVFPHAFANNRILYLCYELSALAMLICQHNLFIQPRIAHRPAANQRLARAALIYAQLNYALWASADVIILSGFEVGFALRIIPNVMYYAGFLALVYLLSHEVDPHER